MSGKNSTSTNTADQDTDGQVVDFNMNFGNINPDTIATDEVINLAFVVDVSTSVDRYVDELNKGFNEFIDRMKTSHLADRIYISITTFGSVVKVQTGFQQLINYGNLDFNQLINC